MRGLYTKTGQAPVFLLERPMPEPLQWITLGVDLATLCGVCILFSLFRV